MKCPTQEQVNIACKNWLDSREKDFHPSCGIFPKWRFWTGRYIMVFASSDSEIIWDKKVSRCKILEFYRDEGYIGYRDGLGSLFIEDLKQLRKLISNTEHPYKQQILDEIANTKPSKHFFTERERVRK